QNSQRMMANAVLNARLNARPCPSGTSFKSPSLPPHWYAAVSVNVTAPSRTSALVTGQTFSSPPILERIRHEDPDQFHPPGRTMHREKKDSPSSPGARTDETSRGKTIDPPILPQGKKGAGRGHFPRAKSPCPAVGPPADGSDLPRRNGCAAS